MSLIISVSLPLFVNKQTKIDMLEEKITLDKLVRWVICALIILAVYFITNSMSEVLLPFFIACLLAYLLYTHSYAVYHLCVVGSCGLGYRRWTACGTVVDRPVRQDF